MSRIWISDADCRLEDFRRAVERHTRLADYPLASAVHSNVLTYEGDDVRKASVKPESRAAMQAEWARAMMDGPGILLFKNAFADSASIDAATELFIAMIEEQHAPATAMAAIISPSRARTTGSGTRWRNCACAIRRLFARYYGNDDRRAGLGGLARARPIR